MAGRKRAKTEAGGETPTSANQRARAGEGERTFPALRLEAEREERRRAHPSASEVEPTQDARVAWIAALMADDAWPGRARTREFAQSAADAWGVALATVQKLAAEAHRRVTMDPALRPVLQARLAARFDGIARKALSMRSKVTGLPDFSSSIKALETYARFSGIELEQKVKVSGSIALEDLDTLREKVLGKDGEQGGGGAG